MSMKHFLQRRHVPFELVAHPAAFDAQHLAHALLFQVGRSRRLYCCGLTMITGTL